MSELGLDNNWVTIEIINKINSKTFTKCPGNAEKL